MRRDAAEKQCGHLLRRRAQRHTVGGVGLLIGSGMSEGEQTRRRRLRQRLLRAGGGACLLLLCTAGGFASAKLWDGRGTSDLDLEFAGDVAVDRDLELTMRLNGLDRLNFFARGAVEELVTARQDPELAEAAELYLSQLRNWTGKPGSFGDYLRTAGDPDRSESDRVAAMGKLHARVIRALAVFKEARESEDEAVRAKAEQTFDIIDRRILGHTPGESSR